MAVFQPAVQSSTSGNLVAAQAVDNDPSTVACTARDASSTPWWAVDLGEPTEIRFIFVTSPKDEGWLIQTLRQLFNVLA